MADIRSTAVGSTTVAANFNLASPSTQFGTRKLSFLNVAITGVATNYALADSLFAKSIRGIQTMAEVWAVGTPVSGNFVVIVSDDTVTNGDSKSGGAVDSGTGYGLLEAAIAAANGGTSATVTSVALSGNTLA